MCSPSGRTQSGLRQSSTPENTLNNTTGNGQPRLVGGQQSGPSPSSTTDEMSNNSTGNGESVSRSSSPSFASDRNEHSSSSYSELSEIEREILEILDREPSPEPEGKPLKSQGSVLKRTPLPNSCDKRSPSPPTARKAPATKPLRVVKRGSKWSEEENALLKHLVNKGLSWQDISSHLPDRSAVACSRHYRSLLNPPTPSKSLSTPKTTSRKPSIPTTTSRRGRWEEEEVKTLNALREAGMEWNEVAGHLPGRTSAACRRKWDALREEQSLKKPVDKIKQDKPETANEDEQAEGTSNEEISQSDIEEEKPKREIVEETYSSSSDEEMSESDIDDQEPESKVEEKELKCVMGDVMADSSSDEDMSESTSEENPSESESEDEAEKKRKHAEFFLRR